MIWVFREWKIRQAWNERQHNVMLTKIKNIRVHGEEKKSVIIFRWRVRHLKCHFPDLWSNLWQADAIVTLIHSLLTLSRSCWLVGPDCQRGRDDGADGSSDGQPECTSNSADVAQDERGGRAAAVVIEDDLRSPSSRVGNKSKNEENSGEWLERTADRKDGAADAVTAADRHEGKEIGDDHECESKDEANDSTAPGVRVEVVVHVREQLFDVVPPLFGPYELRVSGFFFSWYLREWLQW